MHIARFENQCFRSRLFNSRHRIPLSEPTQNILWTAGHMVIQEQCGNLKIRMRYSKFNIYNEKYVMKKLVGLKLLERMYTENHNRIQKWLRYSVIGTILCMRKRRVETCLRWSIQRGSRAPYEYRLLRGTLWAINGKRNFIQTLYHLAKYYDRSCEKCL